MNENPFSIRPFRPGDEDAVYDVCLKTGDAGRDATALYTDPKALGHLYVGPYMHLEPDLAFVLVDTAGLCGYALGALDSIKFYGAYLKDWLSHLQERYARPTGNPADWTPTQRLYDRYYRPQIYFPKSLGDYPSHLHIDLLPRAQGCGNGTRLMDLLLERLRDLGSNGVHLAMTASNQRAHKFYKKLGFAELARVGNEDGETLYLGKQL